METLFLLGLAVSSLAGGVIVWGHTGHVPKAKKEKPPYELVLCVSNEIDPRALHHAMDWWAAHGEVFSLAGPGEECIAVVVNPFLEKKSGETWYQEQGPPIISVIDGRDAQTLAHELGHAAGYDHPPLAVTGSILNPFNDLGGWSCAGLPVRHKKTHHRKGVTSSRGEE